MRDSCLLSLGVDDEDDTVDDVDDIDDDCCDDDGCNDDDDCIVGRDDYFWSRRLFVSFSSYVFCFYSYRTVTSNGGCYNIEMLQ